MGTDVPGLFAAGTFYFHSELVFWDVHDPSKTIIVSLDHERYKKLIVGGAIHRRRSFDSRPRSNPLATDNAISRASSTRATGRSAVLGGS
jgi:hypothetical protein